MGIRLFLKIGTKAGAPVPQQRPRPAHLRRGDPCLGEQVGAQQLGQDRRVDLVVFQPGRGDRLARQRVHQVRGQTRNRLAAPPGEPLDLIDYSYELVVGWPGSSCARAGRPGHRTGVSVRAIGPVLGYLRRAQAAPPEGFHAAATSAGRRSKAVLDELTV
jgi:hypothetical protein